MVIGGGLVGIEAVEVAVSAGRAVTFVMREDRFWRGALDAREARWIAERMRAHGVDVRLEETVVRFVGEGGVLVGVETSAGLIAADCAVVGIGVEPNTEWLRESGLAMSASGAVIVDAQQRASAEGVWAAGDCAAVPDGRGAHATATLWYAARDQGRVAGRSAGGDTAARYDAPIFYNSSKLFDIEHTVVGDLDRAAREQRFEERGALRSSTRLAADESGALVGASFLGRRWDHTVIARWITEARPLEWVCAHLADASFDTELVPPIDLASARAED